MNFDKTMLAIIVIGILEVVALLMGQNGQLLAAVVAIIAGLGGYSYAKKTEKNQEA